MRVNYSIFSMICMAVLAQTADAAPISTSSSSVQPISQYGLIQNVQNYSSNPFWNPNGLYNQRMPQPVYAQGADLNTADCQRTVGTLVAAYCMDNNNCVGMQLSDIRPAMMLRLARLPGHNYATSCAGFIDSEFESYVSKYSNAGPTGSYIPFPNGTVANPALNESEFKIENPYQIRNRTWNNEEWEKEKGERYLELQELQSMNGANDIYLARADYPATANDLTFSESIELKTSGYEPYKDASPYAPPFEIETEDQALSRQQSTRNAWCALHPDDVDRCPQKKNQKNNDPGDAQYCKDHRDDYDKCPVEYCEDNPNDYDKCPEQYCQNPAHHDDFTKCPREFCRKNPTDPRCASLPPDDDDLNPPIVVSGF